MKKVVLVARMLMGLALVTFGLNGFLHFMEPPSDGVPPQALAFINALEQSGYMFPLLSGAQIFCGVLLVTGVFVPLALVVFAPILVNIVGYHIFVDPDFAAGIPAWLMLALELFLAFAYSRSFAGLFELTPRTRFD